MNTLSLLLINTPSSITGKIKWFFHNLRNGAIIKKRKFIILKTSEKRNIWSDYRKHFHFVSEYYPPKNILKSPVVRKTMFDINAPKQVIRSQQIKSAIEEISLGIEKSFSVKKKLSKAWMSNFGSILEEAINLDQNFENLIRAKYFIEFGPGLGFNGKLISLLYNPTPIFYDLPEITNVRSLVLKEFEKYGKTNKKISEEFFEINPFFKKINKVQSFSFISTWAFTETPLELREKFFQIINKSQVALIVSNPKFEDVNNYLYLEHLSKKLINHKHIFRDLGFLKKSPKFLQKHQLHLFLNKNQSSI